jgi:Tfp pilus assembly protein PilO
VSLSSRDKKLVTLLVPIALIAAYWFLALSPKRDEAAAVQTRLAQAQAEQTDAESQAASLSGAKTGFAADYTTVVRLGKAVPSIVDMPSLIAQLDRAARGTDIDFDKIATGSRQAAPAAAPAPAGTASGAQSGPGKAVQAATNASAKADAATSAAQGQPTTAGGTTPSAGGTTPSTGGTPAGTGMPGLESIPLDFTFKGTYFDLADFLHRMKRFVRVVNEDIVVRGRLITIDSLKWKSVAASFPALTAEVHATVYLAPKAEGVSAGATPQGAAGSATPTPAATPAPSTPSPSSTPAPAATVK